MKLQNLKSYLKYHGHIYGHYRFEEPIVVFESDDWGKVNGVSSGDYPDSYGQRSDWSYDQLESTEELSQLFNCLNRHKDDFERKPFFTANFLVSNPDFKKTIDGEFKELHLLAIDKAFPELMVKWRDGYKNQLIFPQYHGRLHYNFNLYQEALQKKESVRYLFSQGINGGLENFDATGSALHSEYLNYEEGSIVTDLKPWIEQGLAEFERIFGFKSKSTIAPNYIVDPKLFKIFRQLGIEYLQGGNKIYYKRGSKFFAKNYCLGTRTSEGLVTIARTQKFEPCRNHKRWNLAVVKRGTSHCLSTGIPAVIDTHRFNYSGTHAANSRNELSLLLDSFKKFKGLRFLSSTELGQAISNQGVYADCFTGEIKALTPKDTLKRKIVRKLVK